jgi:hypothetical protein
MNKELSLQEFLDILKETIESESVGLNLNFSDYSTDSKLKDIGLDSLDTTLTLVGLGKYFNMPSDANAEGYSPDALEGPKTNLKVMDLIVWINKYNNDGVRINVS